jgi:hypothetical protein
VDPSFRNLDIVFEKQNQAAIQTALLKYEQKKLARDNLELKSMLREYFHTLATSSDLAGDGLLSIQRQTLSKTKKKRRPKSCHGRIIERIR